MKFFQPGKKTQINQMHLYQRLKKKEALRMKDSKVMNS